jgi:hypothetical protein
MANYGHAGPALALVTAVPENADSIILVLAIDSR